MDWKILLAYLKFSIGIIIIIFAYYTQIKYYEIIIAIATLIILSSGVDVKFSHQKKQSQTSKSNKSKPPINSKRKFKPS